MLIRSFVSGMTDPTKLSPAVPCLTPQIYTMQNKVFHNMSVVLLDICEQLLLLVDSFSICVVVFCLFNISLLCTAMATILCSNINYVLLQW